MPTNYSPYGFDVNQGTTLPTIQAYINNYASPEAAAADTLANAPRGYDYLVDQYQRLTGDSFADPFEDASSARSSDLTNQVIGSSLGGPGTGISVNVGNLSTGSTINQPASQVIQSRNVLDQIRGNQERNSPLQSAIAAATLSHPEYQLPDDPTAANFTDIQESRAAALGATDLFNRLTKREALTPVSRINPLLQLDEKGKPIAGDVLNASLFNDPEFKRAMEYEPDKAKALYKAIYDRDLGQDITAQRGANLDRETLRTKTLAALADKLTRDEITGEPMVRTFRRNESGEQIEGPPRKLSEPEQNFMEQSGGFASVYGYEPSQGLDVPGATDTAAKAIRLKVKELKESGEFQGESNEQLLIRAKNAIYSGKPVLATPNEPPMPSMIFRGKDFYGPALKLFGPYGRRTPAIQGEPLTQAEADRASQGGGLLELMGKQVYGGG